MISFTMTIAWPQNWLPADARSDS